MAKGIRMNRRQRRASKSKKAGSNLRINPRTQKGKMGGASMHSINSRRRLEEFGFDE
tara:strand:- start:2082 stop:2252 length:171 start_codon:yes stop_codon:yes gene_type:complete